MAKTNKPEFSIKAGAIQLSIWQNEVEKGMIRSITINRTYKDKGGEFQTTTSFRANDLPLIETLIRKAMEYMYINSPTKASTKKSEDNINEPDPSF